MPASSNVAPEATVAVTFACTVGLLLIFSTNLPPLLLTAKLLFASKVERGR